MPKEPLIINTPKYEEGFSLVEVLLAGSIFALLVTALVGSYLYGEESTALSGNRVRATALASEGLEAVRNIRDAGFVNITDGTYGLSTTSNQWNLSGSFDTQGIFTRQITISTIDTTRKNVVAQVTWQQNPQRAGSISLTTRIANWIRSGVSWASPAEIATLNFSGSQSGVKIQISGNYAYLFRTSGGNPEFASVDISNPLSPSLVGSLTFTGSGQNIYVSGNYAYLTNDNNSQEFQIVDISNPATPNVVGTYNTPGNTDALGVFASGTRVYLVRASSSGDELFILNVANPASPSLLGSIALGDTGYEVVVSGNYAYIASGNNSEELQVVNVSNPASPSLVGTLNLPGNTDATTLALVGQTVYMGQGTVFRVVNVSTPSSPSLSGSLTVSGTITDVALALADSNATAFVVVNDNPAEFQTINVSTPSTPTLLGTGNATGNANLQGVAYSSTLDRAFAVGQNNAAELFIFAPQ